MVRGWMAAALALTFMLVSGCSKSVEATPSDAMPGALPGWRQVFADDFTGSSLGNKWTKYSGQPAGDPAGWFDAESVSVGSGMLTLSASYDATRKKWVTGGVSSQPGLLQTYGKYEVRFRASQGKGISYAMVLWPAGDAWPPELDFAEDNGSDRRRVYATLHAIGGSQLQRSYAADFTQWHTVGVEWTPGRLAYTIDGKVWAKLLDSRVPTQPMALTLQTQAWYCGHTWERCPDSSTPAWVDLQIAWVVAYARREA